MQSQSPLPFGFGTNRIGDPTGEVDLRILPVHIISLSHYRRVCGSFSERG